MLVEKLQNVQQHCVELCNYNIWNKTTSGGLPPALLHDVDGPVDSTWRPTDIPIPHFEVAILDRRGQIHTVIW